MSTSVCQNTGLRKADERRPKTNLTYQKHQANVENILLLLYRVPSTLLPIISLESENPELGHVFNSMVEFFFF